MESSIEEALRAKENAEKLFAVKDFAGARSYALKAQTLCPQLEGISHMVATFGIYAASELKVNGEIDFYSVLGLDPAADKSVLKKQYRKMAVLLHPDKNKTVGAEGAFKLVSEAWTLLSDGVKRSSYDIRRNKHLSPVIPQTNLSYAAGVAGFDSSLKLSPSLNRLDTFWTVCTSCHVQYEYLRKYVNKRLSCKNCRGVFVAVETGAAPVTYCPWSNMPENGYGTHAFNGATTYIPNTSVCFTGNGASGFHSAHGSEYSQNVSFQWNSIPGASAVVLDPNGLTSKSVNIVHHANGNISKVKANGKYQKRNHVVEVGPNGYTETLATRPPGSKPLGRPPKKRKVDVGDAYRNGNVEVASRIEPDVVIINGNSKVPTPGETSVKRCSAAPAFDARKLLIDKARAVIRNKLEELRLASVAEAEKKEKAYTEVAKYSDLLVRPGLDGPESQLELKKTGSMPITVPDSDFHDFDNDRAEECFKPKQIWALYDEEDGMPRLYCLIRQVISVKPFQIHISYLNSKTDTEFGSVNWIDSGFTKSCGSFRVFHTEIVDQVNIFSHLLSREKAGRGGCVRIYPRSGDIWAVYRNWSCHWNRTTPKELRHQYEMVEVLDDYSEELGVCVAPLVKLDGYKTVYQRNSNKSAIRWIPRREMLRFSHQVPSCILKGDVLNLPAGCWDLDPAATPDELLQAATEVDGEEKPSQAQLQAATVVHADGKPCSGDS